ncbi:hypothetical protein FUA48_13020 [Flavobacterium alkalisoli]|uniref:Uncharacterized protein n=1 Tax=Flavobacterium alkalisoli TaxID=2602769 RepID=A0A5B9FW95_9FLAO|nr:hypothetical protein [Flavobacterium alkalisoli]QEE50461.1 hypothetical protein FUA48_13020 [Flavobacterium alkalisoli]
MDNIITYTKKAPIAKTVFAYALMLLGLVQLASGGIVIGVVLIALGIGLNTKYGSEINLSAKQYRTIKSVFGITIGNWKPLPEFEYVSVFRTKENQTVRVVTAEATSSSEIILLNLFYNRNKHITFYKTDNKEDAFKVAEHFKLALDIDILDATENEKRWL